MKTITIRTLIICLSFTFFSCDKDEKEEVNENLLLGTWLLTREIDSDGEDDSYESNCRNTWTFTSSQITASYDDNCDGASDETFTETYTVSNNEIVLQDDRAYVRSVTASKLTIEIEDNSDPDDLYSYTLFFDRS